MDEIKRKSILQIEKLLLSVLVLALICTPLTACGGEGSSIVDGAKEQIEDAKEQVENAKEQLENAKEQAGNVKEQIDQAKEQLLDLKDQFEELMDVPVGDAGQIRDTDYAYHRLGDKEQKAYIQLLWILQSYESDVRLLTKDSEMEEKVYRAILMDRPELFYVKGYTITEHKIDGKLEYCTLTPEYLYTKEEKGKLEQQISQAAKDILEGIGEDSSDYGKEKYVYDYIVKNTDYVENAPDNQNIISVLLRGQSVCQGYSYTFQYLLQELGIPCTTVTGTAVDSQGRVQNHAWNIVWIEGAPYEIDVTWGDPVAEGVENEDDDAYVSYDYFNLTTEQMSLDHTADTVVELPECKETAYNYFIYNDCYYDSYSIPLLTERLTAAIRRGDHALWMKFSSKELYEEYIYRLFEKKEIFDAAPALKSGVRYTAEPDRLILVIRMDG